MQIEIKVIVDINTLTQGVLKDLMENQPIDEAPRYDYWNNLDEDAKRQRVQYYLEQRLPSYLTNSFDNEMDDHTEYLSNGFAEDVLGLSQLD